MNDKDNEKDMSKKTIIIIAVFIVIILGVNFAGGGNKLASLFSGSQIGKPPPPLYFLGHSPMVV